MLTYYAVELSVGSRYAIFMVSNPRDASETPEFVGVSDNLSLRSVSILRERLVYGRFNVALITEHESYILRGFEKGELDVLPEFGNEPPDLGVLASVKKPLVREPRSIMKVLDLFKRSSGSTNG